uniref:Putative secreted peptide n=1 Tax=Anopheles braziliensis TaxID=58242 RepID=A0A2M3ZUS3_9DIPT
MRRGLNRSMTMMMMRSVMSTIMMVMGQSLSSHWMAHSRGKTEAESNRLTTVGWRLARFHQATRLHRHRPHLPLKAPTQGFPLKSGLD